MTAEAPKRVRRGSLLTILRIVFLVGALAFAVWGFRANGEEIVAALRSINAAQAAASALLVLVGLALTGVVWGWVLRAYGHVITPAESAATFFVGQIGKYIPGSVWSLAAQADMARARAIPARTTVSVGLIFLWIHLASAIPVAAVLATLPAEHPLDLPWLRVVAAVFGLALVTPPVLARIGRALAGQVAPPQLGWRESCGLFGIMVLVWAAYGLAAYLVTPPVERGEAGSALATLGLITGAFALSYVVGVVIVFAPAGLGAREATLIALTAPALGAPAAAAMALMIRLVHTFCDFLIAGLSWGWLRLEGRSSRSAESDGGGA